MGYTLRPYQKEAIDAILQARRQGKKRLLVCLPTGAGKTVIFSKLVQLAKRDVLVLAHRSELLEQAKDKIEYWLGGQKIVALEQASQRAQKEARVLLCSIRSLHTERLQKIIQGRHLGLVIYDECHHAVAEDNKRVLQQLGVFTPEWEGTLVGFTATTTRRDGLGLGEVFEEIVYRRGLSEMIEENYLVPLRGYRISTQTDLYSISQQDGLDFQLDELAQAIDVEERNSLVARSIQELTRDRRTLVFCVNVSHAIHLAKALNALKHPTGVIHGQLKAEVRAEILEKFRLGHFKALTNIGVLTEGFDDPGVSCVAMARPTRSSSLYLQCIGRGMRLFPEKKDCLILDFVDLSQVEIVTTPSLFGMPVHLQLNGEEVLQVVQKYEQIFFDYPEFEMEAGEITLDEIQRRAAQFDPLTLEVHEEVLAISDNAWYSLGRAGLVLHFYQKKQKMSTFLVLDQGKSRGKKYQVLLDEKPMAQFSTAEEAIEAVDYEIAKMGKEAHYSAQKEATWRRDVVPPEMQHLLAQLKPPRTARNLGQALQYLSFYAHKINASKVKKI